VTKNGSFSPNQSHATELNLLQRKKKENSSSSLFYRSFVLIMDTPRKFRISSPCSSANLGPGFDVLGISLSLYLTLDVEIGSFDKEFEMTYSGEGAKDVPLTPEQNLITKTALYVLSANGISELPKSLKIHVNNPIPLGRGLGSSGAAVVAGVLLGDALGQLDLSRDRLLDYCLMIERHPDNVAAALMGGFVASYLRELDPEAMKGVPASETLLDIALSQKVPQPPLGIGHYVNLGWAKEIKCIAIVPQFEVATAKARAVLPTQYERQDIVSIKREMGRETGYLSNILRYLISKDWQF
jgi:homoserine kinase